MESGSGRVVVECKYPAYPVHVPDCWPHASERENVRVARGTGLLSEPGCGALGTFGRHKSPVLVRPLPSELAQWPQTSAGPESHRLHHRGVERRHSIYCPLLPPTPLNIVATLPPHLPNWLHGGVGTFFPPAVSCLIRSVEAEQCSRRAWMPVQAKSLALTAKKSTCEWPGSGLRRGERLYGDNGPTTGPR